MSSLGLGLGGRRLRRGGLLMVRKRFVGGGGERRCTFGLRAEGPFGRHVWDFVEEFIHAFGV